MGRITMMQLLELGKSWQLKCNMSQIVPLTDWALEQDSWLVPADREDHRIVFNFLILLYFRIRQNEFRGFTYSHTPRRRRPEMPF